MRSWVVDPATSQRYLLVTTAGAPAVMSAEQEILLLRNDQAIMQILEASARGKAQTELLQEQLKQTKARVALLEAEIQNEKAKAA